MVQPAFEVYGFITHTVCTFNVNMIQIGTDVPSYSDHSYSDILATVTKSLGPKWPFL